MTKRVALLEVSTGHVELLYTQAQFLLQAGYEVTIIVPACNQARIEAFNLPIHKRFIPNASRRTRFAFIKENLASQQIKLLVINTAHGSIIKMLPFMLSGVKIVGIIHGLEKMRTSLTQKILSLKIRRYFVLSRHLYEQCPKQRFVRCSYFYPTIFASYTPKPLQKNGEFWIAIAGQLEFKRRNYALLASALSNALDKRIKFLLLGSHNHENGDGATFESMLIEQGIRDYFIFFDHFIDDATFHSYLQASDIIMPLIYPNSRYVDVAISGSYNLAFAHHKPLIMPYFFHDYREFNTVSLFYHDATLEDFIHTLPSRQDALNACAQTIQQDSRFNFSAQQQRYLALLES